MEINQNTRLVWEGNSPFNGEPIILLMSGMLASKNGKTGNMLQTYILLRDVRPAEAIKTGEDYSICANCPCRPITAKLDPDQAVCYVNTGNDGIDGMWDSYHAGKVLQMSNIDYLLIVNRELRMGSYGEPTAVPFDVWRKLLDATGQAKNHTGYTSKWREPIAQEFKGYCQASCSSETEHLEAKNMGWYTYTHLPEGHPPIKNTVKCPYTKTNGVKCRTCLLCNGAKTDVTVTDSGLAWKKRKAIRVEKELVEV